MATILVAMIGPASGPSRVLAQTGDESGRPVITEQPDSSAFGTPGLAVQARRQAVLMAQSRDPVVDVDDPLPPETLFPGRDGRDRFRGDWTPGSGEALTADDLANAVIERNAGLGARQLLVNARRELVESAGSLDDPRVNYAIAPSTAGDPVPSGFGDRLGVRQVYQVSQTFPWPGTLSLRSDLAEARAEMEEYSREELLLTLVDQSRAIWSELWYVERALATNGDHRQLLEGLEEVAATRYANGLGLQENLLQIRTSLARLDYRETVLTQQRRRLQARLNGLLNQSPSVDLGTPAARLTQPELPPTDAIVDGMLARQPELLALESESEAALVKLRLEEKKDFPDVQLNLRYNELWNDSSLRFQVGVSVNIPLDFGKRSARKAAAGFEYRSARTELEEMRSKLTAGLEQQMSRHDELTGNIALYETQLIPVAEQTFQAASANFEGGGGNFATLVESQRQLLDMRLSLDRMRSERFRVVSAIDRLSGGMVWPLEESQ